MIIKEEDLLHYGILRRSGRYPWNSGSSSENVRNKSYLEYLNEMRAQGLTDTQIAKGIGTSTTQLRAAQTIAIAQQRQASIAQAERLRAKGMSHKAIAERMGLPGESSVRALLQPGAKDRANRLDSTVKLLESKVADSPKGFLDVGKGVENHLGISKELLKSAVAYLRERGFGLFYLKQPQAFGLGDTSIKVLAKPGLTYSYVSENRKDLGQVASFSDDDGLTYFGILPPMAVSPKRLAINYAEDGGTAADGVIYVRRGVPDLSLGGARYAQVRIQVGDSKYLKGMAMYRDDLPPGVDLVFNTNKSDTGNKLDALKPLKDDPDNPFGAVIDQIYATDSSGNKKLTSAMNIVNQEGTWAGWSKSLASQVLSKQPPSLAKAQLDKTYQKRLDEYDEISQLTNATVRKKLLEEFSDGTEAASVHLKAAQMPRQSTHVILPIQTMPETQVYAPKFFDGERVVLIRYPHAGTFEIPELVVNNNHPEAKKLLGDARDAIGINSAVAERLSGADFDGDTVLVIPNDSGKLKTAPALEGLKDFNPRVQYRAYEGMPKITDSNMQGKMGEISNLITDMTIQKAPASEVVRAVRHAMVVIDSANHNLNYKQSAIDNNIADLKAKYQTGGASTLISRAGSTEYLSPRKPRPVSEGGPIDPKTGARVFVPKLDRKTGEVARGIVRSKKLAEVDDANVLSSGTPIERIYASHSNRLKALSNKARLDASLTPRSTYSKSAAKAYPDEVAKLKADLNIALRNSPLERQAQVVAGAVVKAKLAANPDTAKDKVQRRRIEAQALDTARARIGAKKQRIVITPSQWEAIQAGAISDTMLGQILDNADMDVVRDLATPRFVPKMSASKTARAQALLDSGASRAEVAKALGVSLTTLDEVTSAG